MSNSAPMDIKERARINAILTEFVNLSAWTPAMGAMLICGILPVGKPTEIPDENNSSLRNRTAPALGHDVHKARKVLAEWVESYLEDHDCTTDEALDAEVGPVEFLMWCEDSYEGDGSAFKPSWWNYWMAFCGWDVQSGVPSGAPRDLVEKAVELEYVASHFRHANPHIEAPPMTEEEINNEAYMSKMKKVIFERSTLVIAPEVFKALASSGNPYSPIAVWARLREMANSGKYVNLEYVDEDSIRFPAGNKSYGYFSLDLLQQFLKRKQRQVKALELKRAM